MKFIIPISKNTADNPAAIILEVSKYPAISCCFSYRDRIVTVSYTHLDVYKRQRLLSVGSEVQILSGTPESTAASLFSGFAAFFCSSFSR